jgi:hypothetical protein
MHSSTAAHENHASGCSIETSASNKIGDFMTAPNTSTPKSNRALIDAWYFTHVNRWDKTAFADLLCRDITLRGSLGVEVKGYDGVTQGVIRGPNVRRLEPDRAGCAESTHFAVQRTLRLTSAQLERRS